jgi:Nucleotidyl transferase
LSNTKLYIYFGSESQMGTMTANITPVVLCGGSGTRLWPMSRASYPKQFDRLLGEQSLFQASVARLPEPEFAKPVPSRLLKTAGWVERRPCSGAFRAALARFTRGRTVTPR